MCLWGCKNGYKEHQKEAFQLIYLCSQSPEIEFQNALETRSSNLKEILILCLENADDTIKYFILKLLNEWFDEAADHFIVTRSVSAIITTLLDMGILFLKFS